MALKFYWGLEANSTTLGASDYSSGDTTASTVGGASITSTDKKIGTYGLTVSSGSTGNMTFTGTSIWPATSTTHNTSRGSFGFWCKFPSAMPSDGTVVGVRVYGSTTNYAINVRAKTGGYLSLAFHNSTVLDLYNSTTALSAYTWYFVVCRFDIANNKRAIEVYADAGGSTLSLIAGASVEDTSTSLSSALSASEVFTNLNIGVRGSTDARVVYFDNFLISDAYDAPLQNNAFITAYGDYSESTTVKKLKLLAHKSAASETGVSVAVFEEPTTEPIHGPEIGQCTGQAFEAATEGSGDAERAVLLVPVTAFGGDTLTTSDTPVALARNASLTTEIVPCTVVEV